MSSDRRVLEDMRLYAALRRHRKQIALKANRVGFTQESIAIHMGVNDATVNRWIQEARKAEAALKAERQGQ